MTLKLYMDHHVPRAITTGLRLRNIDVLTAYEDHSHELADPDLLDRAAELGRVLFTQDDDLLIEASYRQQNSIYFGGIIFAHHTDVAIGQCVHDLEIITTIGTETDVVNQVLYLPF